MGIMDLFKKDKPTTYVDANGKPVAESHVSEITKESKVAARRQVNNTLGKGGGRSLMEGMFNTAGNAGQGIMAVMLAMLAAKLAQGSGKFLGPLFDVFKSEAIQTGTKVEHAVPFGDTAVAAAKAGGRGVKSIMRSDTVQTGVKAVGGVAHKAGDVIEGGVDSARDLGTRAANDLNRGAQPRPPGRGSLQSQIGPRIDTTTLQPATVIPPAGGTSQKSTATPRHGTGAAAILDGGGP